MGVSRRNLHFRGPDYSSELPWLVHIRHTMRVREVHLFILSRCEDRFSLQIPRAHDGNEIAVAVAIRSRIISTMSSFSVEGAASPLASRAAEGSAVFLITPRIVIPTGA